MGGGIEDGRKIAHAPVVEQVGDVGQQHLARAETVELSVNYVVEDRVGSHGGRHAAVGICLAYRAFQTVFLHEAADLFSEGLFGHVFYVCQSQAFSLQDLLFLFHHLYVTSAFQDQ